jgi:hypothetical protein
MEMGSLISTELSRRKNERVFSDHVFSSVLPTSHSKMKIVRSWLPSTSHDFDLISQLCTKLCEVDSWARSTEKQIPRAGRIRCVLQRADRSFAGAGLLAGRKRRRCCHNSATPLILPILRRPRGRMRATRDPLDACVTKRSWVCAT